MMRVKKDDNVQVITGKNKGKQGVVIAILPAKDKVMVKDVNLLTHYLKARRDGEQAGIKRKEGFIPLSNVMPVCPGCKKPCRVGTTVVSGASNLRVCRKCKNSF